MGFCIWFIDCDWASAGFDKSRGSNYSERLKAGENCTEEYCGSGRRGPGRYDRLRKMDRLNPMVG